MPLRESARLVAGGTAREPLSAAGTPLVAVGLVALLAHLPILGAGFVYDDTPIVVENPQVASLARATEWFTSGYWPGHDLYYRPLVIAGYALERAIFGLDARAAHAVNLVWHAVASVSIALLAVGTRRLAGSHAGRGASRRPRDASDHDRDHQREAGADRITALAAGMLFAVHPLLTEPVYWVSARSDVLGAVAVVWGVLAARVERHPASLRAVIVALITLFGLLSKEIVVILPLAIACDATWRARVSGGRVMPRVLSPALLGAVVAVGLYAGLRALAFDGRLLDTHTAPSVLHNPLEGAGAAARLLTPLAVLGTAARLALWPDRLSSDYAFDSLALADGLGDTGLWLGLGLVATAVAATLRSLRGGSGVTAFGLGLAALAWLPVSNTLVLGGALFGERFLYLPAAGLAVVIGGIAARLWTRAGTRYARSAIACVLVLLSGAYTARDMKRARDWQGNGSLYASVVRARPGNAQGHYNLGSLALEAATSRPATDPRRRSELEQAEAHFTRAAEIFPSYLLARINVGVARAERGDWNGALSAFEAAARTEADDARVQFNLGLAYENLGQRRRALAHYRRSAALVPGGGPAAAAIRRLSGPAGTVP